ncbi:MAG TPA: hypothetical protein VIS06_09965 [Mycobacteriales bacterium]|jgi:hypothetical protein
MCERCRREATGRIGWLILVIIAVGGLVVGVHATGGMPSFLAVVV